MLQKALKSLKDVFSQNSFFRFWPPVWRKSSFFYQAEFGKEKREFTEAKHKGRVMVCLSNFKETQKLFSLSTKVICVTAEHLENIVKEKIEIMCFFTTQR